MTMARAHADGGKVTTIEKFDHFADICRSNGWLIASRLWKATPSRRWRRFLKMSFFDLAFIDGNKERYAYYFEGWSRACVRAG